MKKIVVVVIGLLFFSVACTNKKKEITIVPDVLKNHLQRNHLFGQVKEVTTEMYLMIQHEEDSLVEEKNISTTIQHYSADGFLKSVFTLNSEKDTIFKEKITYSSDAKVIAHRKFDKNRKLIEESIFEYDKNSYKVGEKHFDNNVLYMHAQYKNDAKGNAIEMIQQQDETKLKNRFYYNDEGLIVKMEEYDPAGKLFKFITYEYDNYGDEVNRQVFNAKGKQLEYTYKTYNQQGHILKVLYEDLIHGLKTITTYTEHDQMGNWLALEYKKQDEIIYKQKRTILYY